MPYDFEKNRSLKTTIAWTLDPSSRTKRYLDPLHRASLEEVATEEETWILM